MRIRGLLARPAMNTLTESTTSRAISRALDPGLPSASSEVASPIVGATLARLRLLPGSASITAIPPGAGQLGDHDLPEAP
jgi:hypothetical protein